MPQTVTEQPTHSPKIDKRKFNRFAPGSAQRAVAARAAKRQQAIPTTITTQSIDNVYKAGVKEWIAIAAHFRKDIRKAQQVGDKKAIVAVLTAAGIAWDKAFPKHADDLQPLVSPLAIIEHMAKLVSRDATLPVEPVVVNPTTLETPVDTQVCDPLPLSES